MIRSVRQILQAMLKEQIVTDEALSTVMAEVVNILNSRPLTRNSDSPQDEQPLTPNHLLHLRVCLQVYSAKMITTAGVPGGKRNIWLVCSGAGGPESICLRSKREKDEKEFKGW